MTRMNSPESAADREPPDAHGPTGSQSPWEATTTCEGYDRWSAIYDHEDNPLIALEEPQVAALLGEARGLRIADIGCGTGRHAVALAASGAQVVGVDFSQGMLNQALAKPGGEAVQWVCHDLARGLPFADADFDRVLCCLVLDHIPDLDAFFRELRRICRPDGRIIVSVMHPAMMLRGVQARFTDSRTGREVRPASCPHQISDYVMAVVRAGLRIEQMRECAVDAELAARMSRAEKYLNWPVLVVMAMRCTP